MAPHGDEVLFSSMRQSFRKGLHQQNKIACLVSSCVYLAQFHPGAAGIGRGGKSGLKN